MSIQSYFDEFKQNYEKPQVEGLIVGFSGIDPQRKSSGAEHSDTISDTQKNIVLQLIRESLSVIDFSDCNCDPTQLTDAQKNIIYQLILQRLDELNISNYDNSTLSEEQRQVVKNIIDERLQEFILTIDSGNIDSGNDDEQEHILIDPANINHENLNNLLGGNADGHYHLTKDELLKIAAYPQISDVKHENMPDLLGGNSNGHFHLDDNEIKKLRIMIKSFFPDGSDNLIIEVKPVAPVNPDVPDDDSDIYGGLPKGTPPAWELRMLPDGYELAEGMSKMHYGEILLRGYAAIYSLFVHMKKSTVSSNSNRIMATTDFNDWENAIQENTDNTKIGNILANNQKIWQYLYIEYPLSLDYKEESVLNTTDDAHLFFISSDKDHSKSASYMFYTRRRGSDGSLSDTKLTMNFGFVVAGCYSQLLKCVLFASTNHMVRKVSKKGTSYTSTAASGGNIVTVNPGCAAWHPTTAVFCLTGKEGTSTSFDGQNWTFNPDAPHDLRDLSYRQDLDNFVAWSGEDKTLYASPDGINWNQLSDTPIPLENISTVIYEPSKQWYCAVGIGDGNAYFSKNLKAWVPTKLRNNSPVDVADIIFMPSTGLYVAMPTSGTYYYTFNPSNWTD